MRSVLAVAADRMIAWTGLFPAAVVAVVGTAEPRAGELT